MQVVNKNPKSVQDETCLSRVVPGVLVEVINTFMNEKGIYLVASSCRLVSLNDGEVFQAIPDQPVRILEGVTYYQYAPSQNFVDRHLLNNNR